MAVRFLSIKGEIVKELKYFEEDFLIVNTKNIGTPQLQVKTETIEKIHDALVLGIRDYFRKIGFRKPHWVCREESIRH
jgi:NAD+ synthase (glutamine-hydrolysing)